MKKLLFIILGMFLLTSCFEEVIGEDLPDSTKLVAKTHKDSVNKLEWQVTLDYKGRTWEDANNFCQELKYNSKEDWRLPTLDELKTIIVGCNSKTDCYITDDHPIDDLGIDETTSCFCSIYEGPAENGFYWDNNVWDYKGEEEYGRFWTATLRDYIDSTGIISYFVISFCGAEVMPFYGTKEFYTRCVRDI